MQFAGNWIDKLYYVYYNLRPLIPRSVQITLRRRIIDLIKLSSKDVWPIDKNAGTHPGGWKGWPKNKKFAVVLTHDVETEKGQANCLKLMKMEEDLGFRSSFGFVPKRYSVKRELRDYLSFRGFEIVVHGLYHDGKLYQSREVFKGRSKKINQYIKEWNAIGFRSPSMHYNLKWIHDLNIEYDSSTFDTDPFEPDCKGMGTIFPFFVSKNSSDEGYVELPYTLPQDFTIFILMQEKNIDIWKQKLDWIAEKGGMALLTTHPDYMNFGDSERTIDEYPADYYREILEYINERYKDQCWRALPGDVADYFTKHVSNLEKNKIG